MKQLKRAVSILLALIAIGGLVACGSDDSDSGTGNVTSTAGSNAESKSGDGRSIPAILVTDGKPIGGVQELEFSAGEEVRFAVRSTTADEVHIHGYDISEELPAGRPVVVSFPADIEGIFEVELHESGEQIAELRVNP